jgi:4-hydroxybenzoate polyprenyltransferase
MTLIEAGVTGAAADVPLCVDMDGTLILTDSLYEGLALLVRRNPLYLLAVPFWRLRGKAALKREIAERAPLDAARLPYNAALVAFLERMRGTRPLILCTAAHERYARAVADHLGLFDRVMSTGESNFSPNEKANALVAAFGEGGFDYAAERAEDMQVFSVARRAIAVNPTPGLRRRLPGLPNLQETIEDHPIRGLRALPRIMRLHQWVKNVLVFVPLVASQRFSDERSLLIAVYAFLIYGLCAWSAYMLNDVLDLNADRAHPRKRHRPIASGALSIRTGMLLVPALLILSLSLAWMLSTKFAMFLAAYFIATNLYAFWLKRVPMLDVSVLAGLYTLRILAGAAAIDVVPSFWLLAFSMFFFYSLALAKRHSELVELVDNTPSLVREPGHHARDVIPGRSYRAEDLSTIISQGTSSGLAAVLVLAFYINSDTVREHYRRPEALWLICPLMLYWIAKLWLNAQRRQINDDPVIWALTNRVSRAIAVLCVALFLLAI